MQICLACKDQLAWGGIANTAYMQLVLRVAAKKFHRRFFSLFKVGERKHNWQKVAKKNRDKTFLTDKASFPQLHNAQISKETPHQVFSKEAVLWSSAALLAPPASSVTKLVIDVVSARNRILSGPGFLFMFWVDCGPLGPKGSLYCLSSGPVPKNGN